MNLQQTYNEIKNTLNADWMPTLETETLAVMSHPNQDNHQAWQLIKDFKPTQGWLQTLDNLTLVQAENWQSMAQQKLISGELVNDNAESLHIRPAQKGQLSVTLYIVGQGENYTFTEASHQIKHQSKTGQAHYRLYWLTESSIESTQPTISRLVKVDFEGDK